MTADYTAGAGALEKALGLVLKPHLMIRSTGDRATEVVGVQYPATTTQAFSHPGSTASGTVVFTGPQSGRARYIRAWVWNYFGQTAQHCQVFVESIRRGSKILDAERSPLHWADSKGEFAAPFMKWGYKKGHWVDICAADSVKTGLQVISEKWLKAGYHIYKDSGTYTLSLVAESRNPCSVGRLEIDVQYDSSNWNTLRVIAQRERSKWLRAW